MKTLCSIFIVHFDMEIISLMKHVKILSNPRFFLINDAIITFFCNNAIDVEFTQTSQLLVNNEREKSRVK